MLSVARAFASFVLLAFSFDSLLSGCGFLGSNKRSSALFDHALVRHVGPVRDLALARGALPVPLLFAWLLFQLASVGAPLLSALEAIWEQEMQSHLESLARQALAAYILQNF